MKQFIQTSIGIYFYLIYNIFLKNVIRSYIREKIYNEEIFDN